jgi:ribosomal protein S18 acetylase RimI-like enzyme
VKIRPATEADEAVLRELWEEFEAEVPEAPGFAPDTWDVDWEDIRRNMTAGVVLIAEDDDGAAGMLEATAVDPGRWNIGTVHVRRRARRQGVAKALVRECAQAARERGASYVSLEVLTSNGIAEDVWRRLGFEPVEIVMGQTLDSLEARLAGPPDGQSKASTHVQSDDGASVERALAQFVPRLVSPEVRDAEGGWIRISDPLLDSDRESQSRLAHEVSERLGAVVAALALERGAVVRLKLYENGRMVDEDLSVPAFYGELSKADELALEANPTLISRLTGADRGEVRATLRTAVSPADLLPAGQLYEQAARVLGLEP